MYCPHNLGQRTSDEVDNIYSNVLAEDYVRYEPIYKKLGKSFIPYKENKPLQQLISGIKSQTGGEFKNITQSLGFAVKNSDGTRTFQPIAKYYQRTLDNASMDILSGAFDYNTVLKRTVKEMTNSGLRTVDYESGRSNRVDVAARRAVMTGFNQVVGKITEENAEELGTDKFEVTYHRGARPTHQPWQGRVYSKSELVAFCGYGEVDGLKGANCYHDFHPFIEGVSKRLYTDEELDRMNADENTPKEFNGKQYTAYEAQQRQHRLETTLRAKRQEISLLEKGGASEDDINAVKAKYHATSNEYAEFSKAMNLPQQRERVNIDGLKGVDVSFGNSAKIEHKAVEKSAESGIIKAGRRFNTNYDPMREAMGSAEESHPHETEALKQELSNMGVGIKRPKEESLGYQPSVIGGMPGTVIVSEGASYSAWLHEAQHAKDDCRDGWLGYRVFENPKKCRQREIDAYQIEIDLANSIGRKDIAKRLEELRDDEIKKYIG